jgi:hypothetical protein
MKARPAPVPYGPIYNQMIVRQQPVTDKRAQDVRGTRRSSYNNGAARPAR